MILNNLFKSKSILGIDIGSHSIKIIQLKGLPGKWVLERWSILPLPEETVAQEVNPVEKENAIVKTIKDYISSQKVSVKNSAISVSGSSVIVRYVKFPRVTKEYLSKNIQFESEPYIPFDVREVNLGFYILGNITEEGQEKTETVLVAAKKDIVQNRTEILREAGLIPVVIDVDAFAIESSYEINKDKEELVLVVNIGANVSNLSIIENGVSKVVRDIFLGGDTFTKALQKNLQCDYKTAEELKRKHELLVSAEDKERALKEDNKEALQVSNILSGIARDLLGEVHRSIDFFYAQKGEQHAINRILLCGGSALLKNIDKYFEQELKIPVEIFNPLAKVEKQVEVPQECLPILSVACGLATRRQDDVK